MYTRKTEKWGKEERIECMNRARTFKKPKPEELKSLSHYHFRITKDLKDRFDLCCKNQGLMPSTVIKELMVKYLEEKESAEEV